MIRVQPARGRPAARPIVAECDTPAAAIRAVRTLRAAGIFITWAPHRPYVLRAEASDAEAARAALETLEEQS